jgi:hypothetical protein
MDQFCGKKIIKTEFGFPMKTHCQRPSINGGLCSYHAKKAKLKATNWGERKDHRPATLDDMLSGRYMKMKDTNLHFIFRYRKGTIEVERKGEWVATATEINHELFCVKID